MDMVLHKVVVGLSAALPQPARGGGQRVAAPVEESAFAPSRTPSAASGNVSRAPLAGETSRTTKANSLVFSVRRLDPSRTRPSNIIATNSETVGSQSHSLRQLVMYSQSCRVLRQKCRFSAPNGHFFRAKRTTRMDARATNRCDRPFFSNRDTLGSLSVVP